MRKAFSVAIYGLLFSLFASLVIAAPMYAYGFTFQNTTVINSGSITNNTSATSDTGNNTTTTTGGNNTVATGNSQSTATSCNGVNTTGGQNTSGCAAPTTAPVATPTPTPSGCTTDCGGTSGGSANNGSSGGSSGSSSSGSSSSPQAVLGASSMASTGTFMENLMNSCSLVGTGFFLLGGLLYKKNKSF